MTEIEPRPTVPGDRLLLKLITSGQGQSGHRFGRHRRQHSQPPIPCKLLFCRVGGSLHSRSLFYSSAAAPSALCFSAQPHPLQYPASICSDGSKTEGERYEIRVDRLQHEAFNASCSVSLRF